MLGLLLKNLSTFRKPDLEQKHSLAVITGRRSSYGESGMCVSCKEHTEVGFSCCGKGTYFEGGIVADLQDDDCDCSMGDDGVTPSKCPQCVARDAR